jgi:hypothetical protein
LGSDDLHDTDNCLVTEHTSLQPPPIYVAGRLERVRTRQR